jgi:RNase P subunit RPR2
LPRTTDSTFSALSRSPPTQARTTCATCSMPAVGGARRRAQGARDRVALMGCVSCDLYNASSYVGRAQGRAAARRAEGGA